MMMNHAQGVRELYLESVVKERLQIAASQALNNLAATESRLKTVLADVQELQALKNARIEKEKEAEVGCWVAAWG